jgi:uncharacterized membrane protein YeaQ/YmgE (transglycosylase-associated protein family)
MLGELIGVVLLGLIAGYIGKALMPGKDPGGVLVTIGIGIAGSLVGYFIFTGLLNIGDDDKFDFGGIIGAIIGTMILLFIYRKFAESRTAAGPATPAAAGHRGKHRRH